MTKNKARCGKTKKTHFCASPKSLLHIYSFLLQIINIKKKLAKVVRDGCYFNDI